MVYRHRKKWVPKPSENRKMAITRYRSQKQLKQGYFIFSDFKSTPTFYDFGVWADIWPFFRFLWVISPLK